MENKRDYYDILGLEKNADAKAIKDSFRKLALKYHPDRNKEPQAQEKFKEITEAYAILSDPRKREEYDNRGFAGVADFSQEDLFSGINFDEIFGGAMDLNLGNFGGGLFDSFFTKRYRHNNRGEDIRVELTIPLHKILTGSKEEVDLSHLRASTLRSEKIDNPEKLLVKIPIGAEEGMILRIPEHGFPSEINDAKAGDLLVIIRSKQDPYFSRIGADLWHTETINILDAVLGIDINILTLEEVVKLHVPQGVQHDTILRISKKGLPYLGNTKRGDLYVRINLHVPEKISDKERLLYERLRSLAKEPANATKKVNI